jgi:hypothetical protein
MKNKMIMTLALIFFGTPLLGRSVADLAPDEKEIKFGLLNLSSKGLTSLDGLDEIEALSDVTELALYENDLTDIPAGAFDRLTSLMRLNLSKNKLTDLPRDIFENLRDLTQLHLGFNLLADLPTGIFDNLSALKVLILRDNRIETLQEGIFDTLGNLRTLYLSGNELTELPQNIFNNLMSLKALYIDDNRLPASELAWVAQFCEQKGIHLSTGEQKAPPLVLDPNVSEEEWEAYKEDLGQDRVLQEGEESSPECQICLAEIEQSDAYKTACEPKGHVFHADCLKTWLEGSKKTACPSCRQDVFVGGEFQRMPVAQVFLKKQDRVHVAQHAKKKKKKKHRLHLARRNKKSKVSYA